MDAERRWVPKRTKIGAIIRPNVQLESGPMKKYNDKLSVMGRKQKISENIAAKLNEV